MLRVERVAITHPHALSVIEAVQAEYVVRYGSPDETPLEPAYFEPPQGSFFLGYVEGRPVVSGAWRRRPVPEGVGGTVAAEVKRMYVDPAHRGRGLARTMLAHLERDAAAYGADVVVLESGLRQPEALALYASSGYRPIPAFGHYAGEPLCRCFGKELS